MAGTKLELLDAPLYAAENKSKNLPDPSRYPAAASLVIFLPATLLAAAMGYLAFSADYAAGALPNKESAVPVYHNRLSLQKMPVRCNCGHFKKRIQIFDTFSVHQLLK